MFRCVGARTPRSLRCVSFASSPAQRNGHRRGLAAVLITFGVAALPTPALLARCFARQCRDDAGTVFGGFLGVSQFSKRLRSCFRAAKLKPITVRFSGFWNPQSGQRRTFSETRIIFGCAQATGFSDSGGAQDCVCCDSGGAAEIFCG